MGMLTNALIPSALADLTSDALTARLQELRGAERLTLVDLLWHLGEMDRRRSFLELGFPSLFAYCTDALGYPKASAFRRTTSARLLQRFPVAGEYLADGRLNLSTFLALKDVLQPENHRELLDSAAGRTEHDVEVLVASRQPRPEVKESIRKLPTRAPATVELPTVGSRPEPVAAPAAPATAPTPPTAVGSTSELALLSFGNSLVPAAAIDAGSGAELPLDTLLAPTPMPTPTPRPRIQPIDADRHSLKMTVGPEFIAELDEVKSALSHVVPDGNLEAILRACFQKTLEHFARRKQGARKTPEQASHTEPMPEARGAAPVPKRATRSRWIPNAVRRAVWKRDGGCCAFIGKDGRRCGSRYQLEYDHLKPFAEGGEATVDGIALHCRSHNLHRARQCFGEAHMAKFSRADRRPRNHPHTNEPGEV